MSPAFKPCLVNCSLIDQRRFLSVIFIFGPAAWPEGSWFPNQKSNTVPSVMEARSTREVPWFFISESGLSHAHSRPLSSLIFCGGWSAIALMCLGSPTSVPGSATVPWGLGVAAPLWSSAGTLTSFGRMATLFPALAENSAERVPVRLLETQTPPSSPRGRADTCRQRGVLMVGPWACP